MFKKIVLSQLFAVCVAASAAAASPTLFFTDLTSAPVGAIVTIYGSNLSGTVTVNGKQATTVASSSTKVSFVVPQTSSGSILVGHSNALSLTIRSGHIYYVANNGSNGASGSQSSPWGTIPYAFDRATCSDVVYVLNGVSQTTTDNYDAALSVQQRCTSSNPIALVGYPGATVTLATSPGLSMESATPMCRATTTTGLSSRISLFGAEMRE